jgi:hypothetical protein
MFFYFTLYSRQNEAKIANGFKGSPFRPGLISGGGSTRAAPAACK